MDDNNQGNTKVNNKQRLNAKLQSCSNSPSVAKENRISKSWQMLKLNDDTRIMEKINYINNGGNSNNMSRSRSPSPSPEVVYGGNSNNVSRSRSRTPHPPSELPDFIQKATNNVSQIASKHKDKETTTTNDTTEDTKEDIKDDFANDDNDNDDEKESKEDDNTFESNKIPIIKVNNPLVVMLGIGDYVRAQTEAENTHDISKSVAVDYQNMINLWPVKYNYKIYYSKKKHSNDPKMFWTETEIFDFLNDARSEIKTGNHDGLILIISSHGGEGCIIDSKRNKIDLNKIFSIFIGYQCRALVGHPKIFFMDCCRGDTENELVESNEKVKLNETDAIKGQKKKKSPFMYETAYDDCVNYIYVTTPGKSARGSDENGGYLISNIVNTFKQYNYINEKKFTLDRIISQIKFNIKSGSKRGVKCMIPESQSYGAIQVFFQKRLNNNNNNNKNDTYTEKTWKVTESN